MRTDCSFPIPVALIAASTAGLLLLSGCSSNGLMIYKNTKQVDTKDGVSPGLNRGIFGLKNKTRSPKVVNNQGEARPNNTAAQRTAPLAPVKQPANKIYIIRKGDTLSQIALDHKVGIDELASLNNIHKDDTILAGQKLKLPYGAVISGQTTRQPTAPRTPEVSYYTVQKGDYLGKIALKTKKSISDLRKWNNLTSDKIHIGWKLALGPGGTPNTPEVKSSARATKEIPANGIHVVKSGESISTIATMYKGMTSSKLKALNGLASNRILPGQELKLRGEITAEAPAPTPIAAGAPPASPVDTTPAVPVDTTTTPVATATTGDAVPPISLPHFVDQQNDTLKSIAEMYGSKVEWILAKNPGIKTDADLRGMKEISVPVQQ